MKFLAVQPDEGGYISFACRWLPYGGTAAARALLNWSILPSDRGSAGMTRQSVSFCVAVALLAACAAPDAGAVELPPRKAGLWELKTMRAGSSAPDMTMQHCTDATTDKEMSTSFSPASRNLRQAGHAEDRDRLCQRFRLHRRRHDHHLACRNHRRFQLRLHREIHLAQRGRPAAVPRDSTTTIEAKWLGACKSDQKPGDIVMPGGMKMKFKDMERLKGMMPKQLPK